jgi:hypothetical protein
MRRGYSTALRNARLDEIPAAIGPSGLLRVFAGIQPATGGAETTKLAELALSATAAAAAAAGLLTFNAISDDTSADASGTATWFRITTAAGAHVIDGTVGTAAADLVFDNVFFVAGGLVSVSSFTIASGNG